MDRWDDNREAGGQRPPEKPFPEDISSGNMTSRRIYPPELRFPEDAVLREPSGVTFPGGRCPPGAQSELFFLKISTLL